MAPRPFPVDPVKTAITIGYRNDRISLIADKLLPRVPVGASKFSWNYIPPAQAFTVPNTHVGRRGRLERVEFVGEERTNETHDYGLEDSIPQSDIDDANSMRARGLGTFDPTNDATELLTDLILLDREIRVAALVQDPATYPTTNRLVLSGGDQFSDPASDVIGTLKSCFDKTLIWRPNTLTLGREAWGKMSSHPQLVNAVKGNVTTKGIVSPEEFVKLLEGEGLKELLIGEAFVNTARKGQAATFNRVWGRNIILTYINPAARPNYGATFGMTAAFGTRVAGSWEDKNIGLDGGMIVRVGEKVREIITAPDAGFLLQNVVAA